MKRRVLAGLLTLIMVLQALAPGAAWAKGSKPSNNNLITIGKLTKKDYPQIDKDTALRVAREQKNKRKGFLGRGGATLFSAGSPYIPGQQPGDADKPKYLANITGKVEAKGLDGGNFDWNKIFGDNPIKLELRQLDKTKVDKQANPLGETGLILTLEVNKAGEFKLADRAGNPTDLPLFSAGGNPFEYQIQVDRKSYENVELIISTNAGTPGSKFHKVGDKQIATLFFTIGIHQLASTKFVSEWHTGVAEGDRPQIEGYFKIDDETDSNFNFPKNDAIRTILRSTYEENFEEDENKSFWSFIDPELEATPETAKVKTDTAGLTFEEKDGVKTVKLGDHKYKYDFKYDVINGGKLTMTEIIPVTFDANGGTFASITEPNAKQEIKKEVDYDGTLTDKAKDPKKDRETFKGWGIKDGENIVPAKDAEFAKIKAAKTFYAIWDNNEITADELTVHESFKNGADYVNDFIPDLAKLKGQVKIKDADGKPQALKDDDKFEILDDGGNVIADGDLKDKLYDKLQEKDNPNGEPTRVEKVKAKVTFKNGEVQTVDIPMKVYKNIYEAKTLAEKPIYVPDDYVRVTLDPTAKAQDSQKTYYYVNPKAQVKIPGTDPTGTGDNKFIKWTMKADDAAAGVKGEDYKLADRHKFEKASTITAQYSADVVPQKGANKPEGVPDNFVKVTFVPTAKATDETKTDQIFWVNPTVEVKIPVKNPVGKTYYTFKEWKIGDVTTGETYTVGAPKKFTEQETTITATYTEGDKIIPFNPEDANPMVRPEGYVKVTFKAETGLKFKDSKAYYVKKDAGVTLKTIKEDTTKGYPGYDVVKGYKFDKWDQEDATVIANKDLVVTAKATPLSDVMEKKDGDTKPEGYVEVKFVPTNKATDATEKIFYVNPEKEVTIPVTNPKGTTYYTFKEWVQADGTVYKPTVAQKFATDTTITATYEEAKNIISYNPNEPITRPDGYVRVTFAADPGLKLTEQKAYYVKKNANIKLGDPSLVKPKYEAQTGYKFKEWDQKDDTTIEAADIVVTAKPTKLDTVIPEKDDKGNPNTKPEGYKEVTYVVKTGDEGKGSIDGVAKFYVNPTEYVKINPPVTKANTGFEFGTWDKDATIPTVYDKNTTITGSFNERKAIIPKTNPDGTENKQPDGYKKVTFVIDPETGGKIADGEIKVYYVNPAKNVTVPQPKTQAETGYEFKEWDQDTATAKKYTDDTIVKGSFKKLDDIVDGSKPKPDGYVTVTFDKGEHGKEITGQTVYYVNPKADPVKTLGDPSIAKPTVKAETGYKFSSWNFTDTKAIQSNITVTAQYESIDDVIPKDKPTGGQNDKPEGYITVTFDKGANGELEGNTIFYINPNKAVVLEDKAPTIKPNTGYTSAGWDTTINKAIQYKDGDKITALYNKLGDVIPQEKTDGSDKPAGYLTVTFDKGEHGTLSGKTVYYVKPNKEVTVPAPTVKPSVGYEFEEWNQALKQTFNQDTKITAQYKERDNIIPQGKPDGSDKPNGYVTVKFEAVNGTLSGTTTYYVNGTKEVDLTDTAKAITKKPDVGYTEVDGTWNPVITKKQYATDETYTFKFVKLPDVIPEKKDGGGTNTKPDGYVKVTLIPTNKATDNKNKVFFVNPKEKVEIKNKPQGKEITDANGSKSSFKFIGWTVTRGSIASWPGEAISGKFIEETEITAKYEFAWINLVKEPIAEENIVTGKGDKPKPEDLIKNKYDKNHPTNTNNLPEGTTFTYEEEPKVDEAGNITAKVKVEYPGGAITIVEVPIKVVDHVVPQTGTDKPNVPNTYVKVTVDTTDKAVDNTKFTKVFWVKSGVEVAIPGILDPTGKLETDAKGVTQTNNFKEWKLEDSNPEITYAHGTDIKGIFTAKESKIVAIYEYGKNVDPQPNSGQWIPKGSVPSPKDFIKNPYNDDDPSNPSNLPSGTKIEFDGPKPDTSTEAKDKSVTIKITYPNGEVRRVPITYNVTGDVVEQPDPKDEGKKPTVPDNFVKVIVDKTESAQLATGENQTQVFWVNPTKVVTIPVNDPMANEADMVFTGWNKQLTQRFTDRETTITAKFSKKQKPIEPLPTAGYVITERGVQPKPDDYKKVITPPAGKTIKSVAVVTPPNVDKGGMTTAKVSVTYEDNTSVQIPVQVFVQNKEQPIPTPQPDPIPQPYPTPQPNFVPYPVPGETKTVYKDRTVLRREVRYMQGFEGKFRPDDGLTRAEAAQILANALKEDGYPFDLRYKLPYKDTTKEMWYNDAVRITTQADVFIGYDDGEFKPQRKITRAEWIATLRRFQYVDKVGGNSLHMRKNHWAIPEVEAAYRSGWLSIYTEKKAPFNYDEPISRKEVAAVSNRAFRRVRDMAYIRRNDKFMINYTDINRDMWAYDDILCASNTFLHQRQGAYIAYKRGDKAYTIDVKDAIIEQDLFQRIPRHR